MSRQGLFKAAAIGAAAGLAGGVAMDAFQWGWNRAVNKRDIKPAHTPRQEERTEVSGRRRTRHHGEPDATEQLAQRVNRATGSQLDGDGEHALSRIAHFGLAAGAGAAYGIACEMTPRVKAGAGSLFGASVFVTADQAMMSALGLARKPKEYPIENHLYSLAAHVVYGVATEMTRRALSRVA